MPLLRVQSIGHSARLLRSPWLAIGLIVLAVSAAYSNSLFGPFVNDDVFAIADNPTIRSLWPISKVLSPPGEGRTVQGRPVVNLSLAINYALGGERVVGYHLFNLAVHILAASVLFGIVRRTLLLPGQPARLAGQSTGLALAITLLWGVHPLTTSAVTYVIQRAESLMALFYLLTLYCVIRSATGRRRGLWQTAAVLACLPGAGCKEVMASAPLAVLLYDRVFLSPSFKECFQKRGLLYAGLAATWVLLAWLVIGAGTRGDSVGFGGKAAWWAYALTQCQAIVMYLKLCFWPRPLVFYYGDGVITDLMQVLPQALLLAVLLGGALACFRWQPWIGFLGVCFFAILAPSSSVVPVITEPVAERRMYLPLAALASLMVLLFHRGWQRIWAGAEQYRKRWRWVPALALVAAVSVLGGLTFCRNKDYRTVMALWTDLINKRPEVACAYNSRGLLYQSLGQFQQALQDFNRAVALKPDYVEALYNRANAYLSLGQFQQAVADCTQVIALQPDYFVAYGNRGHAYRSLGRYQEALEDCTKAIALRPDFPVSYYNRALTCQNLGRLQDAIEDYTRAISLSADYGDAYVNRGQSYLGLGRYREAVADFTRVIALEPAAFDAYQNRGIVYHALGQLPQAIDDFTQAIALKPDCAAAFCSRAVAWHGMKQYDKAWSDVAEAKRLGLAPRPEFLRALSEASGRPQN